MCTYIYILFMCMYIYILYVCTCVYIYISTVSLHEVTVETCTTGFYLYSSLSCLISVLSFLTISLSQMEFITC